MHILKHHGYDFATWSLLGSDLRKSPGGEGHTVNGDPLRFIHFSGLDSGMIDRAMGWWLTNDNRADFEALYKQYLALLDSHGQATLGKTPWSYASYTSGEKISNEARVAYRNPDLWKKFPTPFASSNARILEGSEDNPTASSGGQAPTLRMSSNPSIIDKLAWSTLEVGFGPTIGRALRKLVG